LSLINLEGCFERVITGIDSRIADLLGVHSGKRISHAPKPGSAARC
jgi:hypothetical protein